MNHPEAFEANFRAPLAKIRRGIVERIAEFDEHVQSHEHTENVFTARVIISALCNGSLKKSAESLRSVSTGTNNRLRSWIQKRPAIRGLRIR
jgi:hypothetical protein